MLGGGPGIVLIGVLLGSAGGEWAGRLHRLLRLVFDKVVSPEISY